MLLIEKVGEDKFYATTEVQTEIELRRHHKDVVLFMGKVLEWPDVRAIPASKLAEKHMNAVISKYAKVVVMPDRYFRSCEDYNARMKDTIRRQNSEELIRGLNILVGILSAIGDEKTSDEAYSKQLDLLGDLYH